MSTVHLTRYGPTQPNLLIARVAPFDQNAIDAIKAYPGREFNKANGVWLLPLNPDNVIALRDRLKAIGAGLRYADDVRAELTARWRAQRDAAAIRDAGDAALEWPLRTTPYAHQRAGLAFLARLGSGALFWEMGLGKTAGAIAYAEWLVGGEHINLTPERSINEVRIFSGVLNDPAKFRVLVITPNTVARNWGREIEKHAGHADYCVLTGIPIPARVRNLGTARYSIVNCESLSYARFAEAARSIEWDLVIVDESTRFKDPKAARTKALHRLRAQRRVILTGTPITGKPEDAWAQMEFVAPGTFGRSFFSFAQAYLQPQYLTIGGRLEQRGFDGVRSDKRTELVERIDRHAYRILKADVLDLPPKVYADRTVTMTGDQAKAYAQMRDELRIELENLPELTAWSVLTQTLRLTQITAGLIGARGDYHWIPDNAKVRELDDLLNDELRDQQVVVFGMYQRELEELARRYTDGAQDRVPSGYALPIIYGPTPEAVRHELVEQFQRGDRRLLFCQVRTGGIGIDLYASQTAIFYTRDWSLEAYLQAQDRLHRIGQTGTVSVIHLVAEGSIDEQITKALGSKQNLADTLTGDEARRLARELVGR